MIFRGDLMITWSSVLPKKEALIMTNLPKSASTSAWKQCNEFRHVSYLWLPGRVDIMTVIACIWSTSVHIHVSKGFSPAFLDELQDWQPSSTSGALLRYEHSSCTVLLFSESNKILLGYFWIQKQLFLDNENTRLSGWPNRYFSSKSTGPVLSRYKTVAC